MFLNKFKNGCKNFLNGYLSHKMADSLRFITFYVTVDAISFSFIPLKFVMLVNKTVTSFLKSKRMAEKISKRPIYCDFSHFMSLFLPLILTSKVFHVACSNL